MVRPSLYLPDGYVLANGAEVQRADYPRLVALADAQSLWTDDTAANLGLYGKGDGTTTMVLPNWIGRMAQYASAAGASVAAGLPNIKGSFGARRNTQPYENSENMWTGSIGKAIYVTADEVTRGSNVLQAVGKYYNNNTMMVFDASKDNAIYGASTTVQPPAINVLPVLRY